MGIVELTGGILGFVYRESVAATLQQELQSGIQFYYDVQSVDNETRLTSAWDHVQLQVNIIKIMLSSLQV